MIKKTLILFVTPYDGGKGAKVLHTYIQTYRPSVKAGPRGAFNPKKDQCIFVF